MSSADLVLALEHLRTALRLSDAAIASARRGMFTGAGTLMTDRDIDAAVRRLGEASMLLRTRIAELDDLRRSQEAD